MTKHFIGFGLFAFIIGVFVTFSMIISPTAAEVPLELIASPPPNFGIYPGRVRSSQVGMPRAIADRRSGEVTIYIDRVPGASDPSATELKASFTFYFVRNNGEPRLIDVVHDSLVNHANRDNDTKWIVRYKADWIKQLAWDVNLYVVPDAAHVPSAFSKETAMPVLVQN